MSWAAIFAMFWEVFGPLVSELVKKLIDNLLNRAAAQLPPATAYVDQVAAQSALLDKAIELLPWYAFPRRSLLRRMRATVGRAITRDEQDEIRGLAAGVDFE